MAGNQAKGSPKVANYRRSEKRAARYVSRLRDRISNLNKQLKLDRPDEHSGMFTARQRELRERRRDKAERLLERNRNAR